MKRILFKDKKRLQIFVSEKDREKIKINAIRQGLSISRFLAKVGTQQLQNKGGK